MSNSFTIAHGYFRVVSLPTNRTNGVGHCFAEVYALKWNHLCVYPSLFQILVNRAVMSSPFLRFASSVKGSGNDSNDQDFHSVLRSEVAGLKRRWYANDRFCFVAMRYIVTYDNVDANVMDSTFFRYNGFNLRLITFSIREVQVVYLNKIVFSAVTRSFFSCFYACAHYCRDQRCYQFKDGVQCGRFHR